MAAGLLGQIIQPAAGNRPVPGVDWIADNGIYSNAYPGDSPYLRWLADRPTDPALCRFAVAPDVVADHQATLERSWPMLRRIRRLGLPVALCAQNGATPDDLPWDYIDAVFLAGIVECPTCRYVPPVEDLPMTDCPAGCGPLREWKLGPAAKTVAAQAKRRGVLVHMGRVNSLKRLRYAQAIGCTSADGTFLAHGPDIRLPELLGWLRTVNDQPRLWEVPA